MSKTTMRGIDHIGVAVPDIEAATTFLVEAFGAEVIYQSVSKNDRRCKERRSSSKPI